MATWEELVRMTQTRNPGMTRTPRGATMGGTTRGAELDNLSREGTAAGSGGAFSAGVSTPVMSSGQSSVPTQSLAPRLARGLGTMTTGVQNSRTSAEASANPRIERQMRRQMATQNSLASRFQEPGSLNPVEARFLMAQQQQNQAAVDSSLASINAMREGAIAERGQNLGALATLEDRQMREAGAFDRELLGLNEQMLAGQFGIAGIQAEGQARDPYAGFTLDIMEQLAAEGDVNTLMGLANLGRGAGTVAPGGSPFTFETGPGGTTVSGPAGGQLPPDAAYMAAMSMPQENRDAFLSQQGYAIDDNGALVPLQQVQRQQDQNRERDQAAAEARRQRVQELLSDPETPMNWIGGIGAR